MGFAPIWSDWRRASWTLASLSTWLSGCGCTGLGTGGARDDADDKEEEEEEEGDDEDEGLVLRRS